MLPKYGPDQIRLAYMDTDSFIYLIKTDDLYEDMEDMMPYLDTSDYPPTSHLHSTINKKVLGKFKDEVNGKIIYAFVGLRPKMYSIKIEDEEVKKAKGVQTAALRKSIKFEDYVSCLQNTSEIRLPQHRFQSKLHAVSSIQINKLALSPHDDKTIILKDGITTHAIGYRSE